MTLERHVKTPNAHGLRFRCNLNDLSGSNAQEEGRLQRAGQTEPLCSASRAATRPTKAVVPH